KATFIGSCSTLSLCFAWVVRGGSAAHGRAPPTRYPSGVVHSTPVVYNTSVVLFGEATRRFGYSSSMQQWRESVVQRLQQGDFYEGGGPACEADAQTAGRCLCRAARREELPCHQRAGHRRAGHSESGDLLCTLRGQVHPDGSDDSQCVSRGVG